MGEPSYLRAKRQAQREAVRSEQRSVLNIPQGAPVTRDIVMAMIGEEIFEIKNALAED
jgi:hypothetical protein